MAIRRALVVGVAVLVGGCGTSGPSGEASARAEPASSPSALATAPPPAASAPGPVRHPALDAPTWREAFALAKPGDATNTMDLGAMRFALWASKRMRWDDVVVAQDETTIARVLKDPEAERGKRICIGSTIVSISVDRSTGEPIYDSLLMTGARNYVNAAAVGSSGDLVKRNHARFCGVIAGLYSYDNTGGGKTHGIQMIGMFDLPENKKRTPPDGAAPAATTKPSSTGTIIDINAL
jgi:hypothetical protein